MTRKDWLFKCNELQEFQEACARKSDDEEMSMYFLQTVQLIRKLREMLIKEAMSQ